MLDENNSLLYCGTETLSPGKSVKHDATSMTRVDAVSANSGEEKFDMINQILYAGTGTYPGILNFQFINLHSR